LTFAIGAKSNSVGSEYVIIASSQLPHPRVSAGFIVIGNSSDEFALKGLHGEIESS
jgi:hypothetical protein